MPVNPVNTGSDTQLAEWARSDALPSEEEIEALGRLIGADEEMIAGLDDGDRAAVSDAVATVRKHRAGLEASFPVQFRSLVRQSGPTLFPNVERRL